MYEYLQINVILFALFACSMYFLRSVPSRVKFYISLVAMCVWLVPWGAIDIKLPVSMVKPFEPLKLRELSDVDQLVRVRKTKGLDSSREEEGRREFRSIKATAEDENGSGLSYWARWLNEAMLARAILAAISIGLFLFIFDILKYRSLVRNWFRFSKRSDELKKRASVVPDNVTIRTLNYSSPAWTSGFFKPIIWIRSDITDPKVLESVITHESVHIQSRDHWWNWLINLMMRCFWWNPMVLYWARRARDFIEFSCDERSKRIIDGNGYANSLMRVILLDNKFELSNKVLGIQGTESLSLARVHSLFVEKTLKLRHVVLIGYVAILGVLVSLALAHDLTWEDLIKDSDGFGENLQDWEMPVASEIYEYQVPYLEFAKLVRTGDLQAAGERRHALEQQVLSAENITVFEKYLAFRVISMYLCDMGDYEEILALSERFFDPVTRLENKNTARLMAIANIRLGRNQEAIDVLETSESFSVIFQGLPTSTLKAQAYHLLENYEKSNAILIRRINYRSLKVNLSLKAYMLRLFGKNSLLLNDSEKVAYAMAELRKIGYKGIEKPDDFMKVSADTTRVPYLYFQRSFVGDERISGFDDERFPIDEISTEAYSPEAQKLLDKAIAEANEGRVYQASVLLAQRLHRNEFDPLLEKDRILFLEHSFLFNIQLLNKGKARTYAQELIRSGGASRAIEARALWILSQHQKVFDDPDAMRYFLRYLRMFDGEPSVSADHEAIKRSVWEYDSKLGVETLHRVQKFYRDRNLVPDIRILNSMVGIYVYLGRQDKANEMRKLRQTTHPRDFNRVFELATAK